MPLVLGSKLGPYQLDALVHSDGRGDVYRGRDLRPHGRKHEPELLKEVKKYWLTRPL